MTFRFSMVLLIAGVSPACLDAWGPEVGPRIVRGDGGGACADEDSDPATEVSYRTDIVEGLFRTGRCTSCHTDAGMGVAQSGFDVGSYTSLRTGGGRSGANIVIDGMPCASILVQKLESSPPFGRRMPYNGPPYLNQDELTLVRDWIAEGARDN
jgi:hypothetical protein